MPTRFKPLNIVGMNISVGPHGDGRCDPHMRLWNVNGERLLSGEVARYSDLELVKLDGKNTVRWGLLARYLWGTYDPDGESFSAGDSWSGDYGQLWEAVTTRLRPVLDHALALDLKVIYPVWWDSEQERKDTLEKLMPILALYPNVIPQLGPNEWMLKDGPSEMPWDEVKAQVDELAARWRELAPGRPWIAPQVCPRQDGSLGIDWLSLKLHVEAWPDAYLGVALYGEDHIGWAEGVRNDGDDLGTLWETYKHRLVVTEHGRSRAEIRGAWNGFAKAKADLHEPWVNAAPMPNWSGCQYVWRNLYGVSHKDEGFAIHKWAQAVES